MSKMYDYIKKEQEVLLEVLNKRQAKNPETSELYQSDEWHIFATGSSYNAALTVRDFLAKQCGLKITYHNNYDYLYHSNTKIKSGVALGISQSGSSTSTIRALSKVSIPKVGLTSVNNSQIGLVVDEVINLEIGIEKVGYVTLGYSATVLNLILLGLNAAKSLRKISYAEYSTWIERIKKELLKINNIILDSEQFIEANIDFLSDVMHYVSVGSGMSYLVSKELDTKFIETIRKPVNIRELDEFMHGQYLQVNQNQMIIFLETGIEAIDDEMKALRSYVGRYNDNIMTIGFNDDSSEKYLEINSEFREVSMLLQVIPVQLMAYMISEYNNSDYMSGKFKDFGNIMNSKNKEEVVK